MALELRIDAQANSTSLTFFELTCKYDVTTNDTGWGTPNPETSDAISAILYLTQPGNTTPTDTIDLFTNGFPSDAGLGYKIAQTSLIDPNNLGRIQDGIWEIEYEVEVTEGETTVPYSTKCKFLFDHGIKCCLAKRVSQINPKTCDSLYDEETTYLIMIHKAALAAFCNQEYARAEELISELLRKCDCCCGE